MVDDQQLGDALSHALHHGSDMLSPPSGLADQIIGQRRARRRRAGLAATAATTGALAIALTGLAISQSPSSMTLGRARLHVASYTFRLPRGAHAVSASATPAACAIGAAVAYSPGSGEGASDSTDQPSIAQAVTADGGCVAMLVTNPYTPGAANTPQEPFPVVDQHTVQIGADTATVGTYELIGSGLTPGSDPIINGVPVPSGTRHVVLTVPLPAGNGQDQDLQVAVAGISEQQLVSIVSSGLTPGSTTTSATS
jgi:hypothetical protein